MRSNKTSFQKRLLASVVASTALAGFSSGSYGQAAGDQMLEEVVVTGIRGSLQRSMDMKRDATGVVDAISAEDIGKFPDTNLAESLQRITGVSIDRSQGEGSEVTVRGFGAGNNMVTLNGRHMPAANVGLGGFSQGTSRAFNFANMASESVTGLEVFKTGPSHVATGGIGATINILTRRPLDNPGLDFSVGVKGMMDTSTDTGDNITPEVSGFFSWTDDTDTFGVSLAASFQERHAGSRSATVNDWQTQVMGDSHPFLETGADVTNRPQEGELWASPNDIRYHFDEIRRERTNAQLTLQYRPIDDLTLTADYTYAENDLVQRRGDQTLWFNQSFDAIDYDGSSVVNSPLMVSENIDGVKDHGFEQQLRTMNNELSSFGFNADWQVNDDLNLRFDVHASSMASLPSGPANSSDITMSFAGPVVAAQQVDYSGTVPVQNYEFNNELRGSGTGSFNQDDIGTQVQRIFYSSQETDITQFRIDGSHRLGDGAVNFGVEHRAMEMEQKWRDNFQVLGDWGINNPGEVPHELFEQFCLTCQFSDVDIVSPTNQVAWRGDAGELARWASAEYDHAFDSEIGEGFDQHHLVEEDTTSAYVQVELPGELGGLPTNLVFGLRYEETDVTSTSFTAIPDRIQWEGDNDFRLIRTSDIQPLTVTADYDNLLPSVDFDIELMTDVKARASFSQTIARAGYGSLRAATNPTPPSAPTYFGAVADASGGNPNLVPLQSDNYDVSVEWYYDDTSYVSVGLFEKRVRNFIGTRASNEQLFDLRDPASGQPGTLSGDAIAALEAREDREGPIRLVEFFPMVAVLGNPDDFPNGADDYEPGQTFADQTFINYNILPSEDDPHFNFRTSRPVNTEDATIHGAEFAVQHFFGDTGFGVQANYTVVRGDVGFDNSASPDEDQFALTGLSDTANLVGIYENYGFSARLAYNWRDKFLDSTSRGSFGNPSYTEAYGQFDLNLSYDVTDNLIVTFEGINLTEESRRSHARTSNQMWDYREDGARYLIGARYSF